MQKVSITKVSKSVTRNIEVRYEGLTRHQDIDISQLDNELEEFIHAKCRNDMLKNIMMIRTILDSIEEKSLVVSYEDENTLEMVKYDCTNLYFYQKQRKDKTLEITYMPNHGGLQIKDNYRDLEDYSTVQTVSKELVSAIDRIHDLTRVKKIILDENSKRMIEIYKVFYQENPNFQSKDINIRMQTMMSILNYFDLSVGYDFCLLGKMMMPISLRLEQDVERLYPFDEIDEVEDNVSLVQEAKKEIEMIGQAIRENVSGRKELNEKLITTSRVLHAKRYNLPSNCQVDAISDFIGRTPSEVKSTIKLVKQINDKIYG
ncbi:MAG TPA: hypothetical protein IAB56_04340 [Candidatus Scybalousia intestinigallinarum]|nr:hypothetical protein [Candidatus Scybalousia intestinigallinarum]